MENTAEKPTYKKLPPTKFRVNLDVDRALWRKYRALMLVRGETLTSRIQFLVRRDIEESRAEATGS